MKSMLEDAVFLWGERIPVSSREIIHVKDQAFPLCHVQARDDTRTLLMLCIEQMETHEEHLDQYVINALKGHGLQPHSHCVHGHQFLNSVEPAHSYLAERFGINNIGIIVLVNGEEPGRGSLPLDEMHAERGDTVQIMYRIERETSERAAGITHSEDCSTAPPLSTS